MVNVDGGSIRELCRGVGTLFGKVVCNIITFDSDVRPDLEDVCGVGMQGDLVEDGLEEEFIWVVRVCCG